MNEKIKEQLYKKNLIWKYDEKHDIYTIPVPCRKYNHQLAFECPFCFTKYKKHNHTPYKNGSNKTHFHGYDDKDLSNNDFGTRTPHCDPEARIYWGLPTIEFKLVCNEMIY